MNDTEKIKLIEFITFYKNISSDIDDLELQIQEINKRKNSLVSIITDKRNEEAIFLDELKDKYGEEAITIENINKILSS